MKELVNAPGRFGADTIDLHQIRDRGALDGFERAEMVEQGALSAWPDTRDLLQAGFAQIAHPPRPVGTDRETMRLVTQPFDEIEYRVARRQLERVATGNKERLAAGVAVGSLGDGDQRDVDAERSQHLTRGIELALPAVDQHEVRPGRFILLIRLRLQFPLALRQRGTGRC